MKKKLQLSPLNKLQVASVPVAIGRAMEHFLERLLTSAATAVNNSASRTLTPAHMSVCDVALLQVVESEIILCKPERYENGCSAAESICSLRPLLLKRGVRTIIMCGGPNDAIMESAHEWLRGIKEFRWNGNLVSDSSALYSCVFCEHE